MNARTLILKKSHYSLLVKPCLLATHHQASSPFDAVNDIQVRRALKESKICSETLVNHSLDSADTSAKLRYFANNSGSLSVQDLAFSPLFLKIAKKGKK
jgi:hypothetical protein